MSFAKRSDKVKENSNKSDVFNNLVISFIFRHAHLLGEFLNLSNKA